MCLTCNHSLSWSTITMLLGMSSSSQNCCLTLSCIWEFSRSSNLLWSLHHSCMCVFPSVSFYSSQPRLKTVKSVPLTRKRLLCGMWFCSPCPHGSEVCVCAAPSERVCQCDSSLCCRRYLAPPLPFPLFPWLSDGAAAFTLSRMSSRPTRLLVFSDISCPKTPSKEKCSYEFLLLNLICYTGLGLSDFGQN